MTEVNFYHLTKTSLDNALPKLLSKALESGKRVMLLADNDERLKYIDSFLWTYSNNDFLPHGTEDDGFSEEQPIFLSTEEKNPNGAEILVTIGNVKPSFVKDFSRCFDIFNGANDDEAEDARERWKKYSEEGLELKYWQQDEKGKWAQK